MDGQYKILDMLDSDTKKKPYGYSWNRYIGQKVRINNEIGVITEIMPYYTIIHVERTHRILAGTPTTCYPVDDTEKTTIL